MELWPATRSDRPFASPRQERATARLTSSSLTVFRRASSCRSKTRWSISIAGGPGRARSSPSGDEADIPEILSGVFEGRTTGTSLAILVRNKDQRSRDYEDIKHVYRPGHADYTYDAKYGFRDYRGGGRSSARETTVRVAAGVVAKKLISASVRRAGRRIRQTSRRYCRGDSRSRGRHARPGRKTARRRAEYRPLSRRDRRHPKWFRTDRKSAKSGGLDRRSGRNRGHQRSSGLGEPVFDKIKADLAKALFSLPAVLGVEYGIGFGCVTMRGSQNNDLFRPPPQRAKSGRPVVTTETNRHGGMLGGITSGLPLVLRAAVKPTSSLPIEQKTGRRSGPTDDHSHQGPSRSVSLARVSCRWRKPWSPSSWRDHWLRFKAQIAEPTA